jgi:hypothetical protein
MPAPGPRQRAWVAAAIYAAVVLVMASTTAPERLAAHTPYNHFALLARGWVEGRLDLGGPPPAYTGNNDFAEHQGRWFVSFPPFPAVLLVPAAAMAGSAEGVPDGRIFLLLTGVGPAALWLALDRLSRTGRSGRSAAENVALALLFALGTVYWFSAVQGTVWFAAHVVGVGLCGIYFACSLDAARPFAAGLALGLGFATRTPLAFAFPLFLHEAWRMWRCERDGAALARRLAAFAAPAAAVLALVLWHNQARFGDALEFGHRLLAIGWRPRIEKWGLFSFHYLPRNLAVVLTSLPWTRVAAAPFQVNAHGLALWFTSPFLLAALWPDRLAARGEGAATAREAGGRGLFAALAVTALLVAAPSLLYQNSGWIQFGYRFSNDFVPFVFGMLAVGRRRLGVVFWSLSAVAVVINAFGAVSFQRAGWERFYFVDPTQKILHQPD